MEYALLGFFTGLSLILALGAQNIFVIEQGLKKQYVFLICLICSLSDLILIFLGIFLFHYFNQYFNQTVELIFNILLIIFLLHFIYTKIKTHYSDINFHNELTSISKTNIIIKTLGFTYLNPHVYSDTMFILGNFSKNFEFHNKIFFGLGASFASFIYFYFLGYSAKFFSSFIKKDKVWRKINLFIIIYMSIIILYVAQTLI